MDFSKLTIEDVLQNENGILDLLKTATNWNGIPMLNYVQLQDFPDHSFVRFRGMIQDMLDPEIYFERFQTYIKGGGIKSLQSGNYRDIISLQEDERIDYDSANNKHGERMSMFMVSIPGLNEWVKNIEKELSTVANTSKIESRQPQETNSKRPLEIDDAEDDPHGNTSSVKKLDSKSEGSSNRPQTASLSAEYLLNSPIPDRPSRACIVKIYSDFDRYILNSIVDVVGFLSVDPVLDGTQHESSEFEEISEIQATNPPPSLIPRLHAVCIRPVSDLNPHFNENDLDSNGDLSSEDIYKDVHLALTQCLFGDHVAASYLMAHIISTVYVRSDLETLGQFCLNVSHFPAEVLPDYTTLLYSVIELLLPASHYFPMTLDNMNTTQFSPKKDYTTNKLTSGLLQLAPHTHLILDETRLMAGKLENNGVIAVSDIAYLINHQKIKCDYKYYQIDFNVDIPVLILSEGKSMLPSTCYIPLKAESDCIPIIQETIAAVKHFLQPKLQIIRKYLSERKLVDFKMNSDSSEMIQNDFVEMRRQNETTTSESLHTLLVLSRLLALCQGKKSLTSDAWIQAKQLEVERKQRIDLLPRRI